MSVTAVLATTRVGEDGPPAVLIQKKLTQEKLCLPPAMLAKEEADTKVSIGAAAL